MTTGPQAVPAPPARALTRDFLTWLAEGPRPYAEVMDAWRTSCPRLSIWEDALGDGLVQAIRVTDATGDTIVVALTPRGWSRLAGPV